VLAGAMFPGSSKDQIDKFERGLTFSLISNPQVATDGADVVKANLGTRPRDRAVRGVLIRLTEDMIDREQRIIEPEGSRIKTRVRQVARLPIASPRSWTRLKPSADNVGSRFFDLSIQIGL
jgi:hypothetical protein